MTALYVLWPLVNLLALLGLLWLLLRFFDRFSERFGCGSAVVLFLLGAGMCSRPAPKTSESLRSGLADTRVLLPAVERPARLLAADVTVLDTPFFEVGGPARVAPAIGSDSTDVHLSVLQEGLVLGLVWQPARVTPLFSSGGFRYVVYGRLQWNLLNIPVYQQPILRYGVAALKPAEFARPDRSLP